MSFKKKEFSSFPSFKKKVSDFLSQEDGRITKQSAVAMGAFVFGSILSAVKDVEATLSHTNDMNSPSYNSITGEISVTHDHHASHSTHSSG